VCKPASQDIHLYCMNLCLTLDCVHMSKVQAFCERKGVVPIVAVLVVPARIVNEPEFAQHHARIFSYEDCKKIFVAPASRSW
jgi:hypothetical protein